MVRCGFMDRQGQVSTLEVGGGPGMCEHTLPLHSTAAVTIIFQFAHECITFIAEGNFDAKGKTKYQSVVYLLGEANPKPVVAARETTAFPAT